MSGRREPVRGPIKAQARASAGLSTGATAETAPEVPAEIASTSLVRLLDVANRRASADLRRVAAAERVPAEFWPPLDVLSDEAGRTVSKLADEIGLLLPATSKLVDKLVDAALVQRSMDPVDRRRVILHISDLGLARVATMRRRLARQIGAGPMSASREALLRELLDEFIRSRQAVQ